MKIKTKAILMMGMLVMSSALFTSCGKKNVSKLKPLPEDVFRVRFTKDETGVVITKCTINCGWLKKNSYKDFVIPSRIQGMPVVEIENATPEFSLLDKIKINSFVIPEGVKVIHAGAFDIYGTMEVESLVLPSTLEVIGHEAFVAIRPETLEIPNSVKIIAGGAFRGCRAKTISIPASVKFIGKEAFAATRHDIDYDGQGIGWISEVYLPEGLLYIAKDAFFAQGIKEITIPKTVICIEDDAFYGCRMLSEINYDEDWEPYVNKCEYKEWGRSQADWCREWGMDSNDGEKLYNSMCRFFSCKSNSEIGKSLILQKKLKSHKNKGAPTRKVGENLANEFYECAKNGSFPDCDFGERWSLEDNDFSGLRYEDIYKYIHGSGAIDLKDSFWGPKK